MPNVAISQCIHRTQHPANAISIAGALSVLGYPAVWMQPQSDALITRGRARAATTFLEGFPDADVLVFIDDDIAFEPAALKKLVDLTVQTEAIACGLYVVRDTVAPHPAIAAFPNQELHIGPDNPPVEIKWGATGFMGIHRKVLDRMREGLPWVFSGPQWFWPFFDIIITDEGEYLSEDYAFCERARRLGIKTWLDQTIVLRHEGVRTYTISDLQASGISQRATITVDEGGPDQTSVIDDLSAFIKVPRQYVADRIGMTVFNEPIAEEWSSTKPHDAAEVREFYSQTGDLWLWELAKWNTGPGYWARVLPCVAARGDVVDFGGGIGTLCIHMAKGGRRMHYVDISSMHREFAEFRFKRHGVEVPSYSSLAELADGSMDAVIATDVLEHIHPDEIFGTAKEMARILKPDGRVIEVSDFNSHEDGMPQHFATYDLWERAFLDLGFEWKGSHIQRAAAVGAS